MFEINAIELGRIAKKYETQCPVLWNGGLCTDGHCLLLLAIGVNNGNYPYYQFLVDDFNRMSFMHLSQ